MLDIIPNSILDSIAIEDPLRFLSVEYEVFSSSHLGRTTLPPLKIIFLSGLLRSVWSMILLASAIFSIPNLARSNVCFSN